VFTIRASQKDPYPRQIEQLLQDDVAQPGQDEVNKVAWYPSLAKPLCFWRKSGSHCQQAHVTDDCVRKSGSLLETMSSQRKENYNCGEVSFWSMKTFALATKSVLETFKNAAVKRREPSWDLV